MQPEEGDISSEPKRVMKSQIDTCNSFTESISSAFDPMGFCYVASSSLGSIKQSIYQSASTLPTIVEIGAPDKSPLHLTDLHVRLMAENLPAQCEALCNDKYYICRE
jgi:hypothetical protein